MSDISGTIYRLLQEKLAIMMQSLFLYTQLGCSSLGNDGNTVSCINHSN